MAIRNGNVKIASLLLTNGALFDKADSSLNSPLHYAAAYGRPQMIELLM